MQDNEHSPAVVDVGRAASAMDLLHADASSAALAIRSQREIEAALTIAAARPRDEVRAVVKIQAAMQRPGMAADAIYSFPRSGQNITGPSVALARVLAQAWGNIRWGIDELPSATGKIHLKCWAWDLESNARVEAEDLFERLIPKSTGRRDANGRKITEWVEPDERDLRELKNRRAAFLSRNCLLQLIPGDIVEDALATAAKTSRAAAAGELKARPADTIRALVGTFADLGVTVDALERRLGHAVTDLTPEELADLRAVYKSIRDGQMKAREAFPVETKAGAAAASSASEAVADATARATAATSKKKVTAEAKAPREEAGNGEHAPARERSSEVGTSTGPATGELFDGGMKADDHG